MNRKPPQQPLPPHLKTQRLNQALSSAGLTSRRKADEWIKSGRVTVNGKLVTEPGLRVIWGRDRVYVDGQEVSPPAERLYIMLNKPFGYICSFNDPEGRPVVTDLLKEIPQRVYPVGRLDFDTLGLLLLTNDGEWTYRLSHPRFKVPRTYKVTVAGNMTDEALRKLRRGVPLEDGPSGPSVATFISRKEKQTLVRVTITRGKSRQVRRMFQAVDSQVIHLIRTGFGTLWLDDLKVGHYRHLETKEVDRMKKLVKMA